MTMIDCPYCDKEAKLPTIGEETDCECGATAYATYTADENMFPIVEWVEPDDKGR